MKRIRRALLFMTLALLSCTAPLYETAEIRKGLTLGGGVGAFALRDPATYYHSYDYDGLSASFLVRYSDTVRAAFGCQGALFWSPGHVDPAYEAYLNRKVGLWPHGSCLIGLGYPRVVSVSFLQDIGNVVTIRIGGGLIGAFDCALGVHPRLTDHLRCHVSAAIGGGSIPGDVYEDPAIIRCFTAGIGLEFLPGSK